MSESPTILRRHAQTCRRLAETEASLEAAERLLKLASEYETQASAIERHASSKTVSATLWLVILVGRTHWPGMGQYEWAHDLRELAARYRREAIATPDTEESAILREAASELDLRADELEREGGDGSDG